MDEGFNNLKQEWEKKLAAANMPEELPREEIPMVDRPEHDLEEFLQSVDPDLRPVIEKFSLLPEEQQADVLRMFQEKKVAGLSMPELEQYLKILVHRNTEMSRLSEEDSDQYVPRPPSNIEPETNKKISGRVDKLIQSMERIARERQKARKIVDEPIN